MRISEFLNYDNIVIQCHDNPDADALASGFGVLKYLKSKGKNVVFAYSGRFLLKKSNLMIMVEELHIPVYYAKNTEAVIGYLAKKDANVKEIGLLVTVDAQYGQGNLAAFNSDNVATIDHHEVNGSLPILSEVRSYQGSCSTIVWDMLRNENFDIDSDEELSTALYYGLMTDTNNFAELHHHLDRDMQDSLNVRSGEITKFRNSNISREELGIAGDALKHAFFLDDFRIAMVATKPCDPNVLGIISDIALEVDSIDTCLTYSLLDSGVKISLRSCSKEVRANEMAEFISEGIGNGGGQNVRAGGFLQRELFDEAGIEYSNESIKDFLSNRVRSFFTER